LTDETASTHRNRRRTIVRAETKHEGKDEKEPEAQSRDAQEVEEECAQSRDAQEVEEECASG
jgi:hypothetical protein